MTIVAPVTRVDFETLDTEVSDGIATLTINRPEVRNAVNRQVQLVIRSGMDADQRTGLVVERLAPALLYTTEDKNEGTEAFPNKRPARFTGQ